MARWREGEEAHGAWRRSTSGGGGSGCREEAEERTMAGGGGRELAADGSARGRWHVNKEERGRAVARGGDEGVRRGGGSSNGFGQPGGMAPKNFTRT